MQRRSGTKGTLVRADSNPSLPADTEDMKKSFWTTLTFSLGYLGLALACLVRWGSPDPWLRVDFFSGGYLALRFLGSIHSLISSRGVFHSRPVMREWWALDSDPAGPKWVMILMVADLTVFLDYGHWRVIAKLEQPLLQGIGLGLYVAVAIWQTWTDAHLARYFNQQSPEAVPMDRGPYRYVRHPRYSAAIVAKVAFALALASVLGWVLAAAWAILLLRKMAVEEVHLRTVFGPRYETYSRRTAKVLPGIY
jgi:protein-S-isoprenylcysteine O-methyltransferase Ste14